MMYKSILCAEEMPRSCQPFGKNSDLKARSTDAIKGAYDPEAPKSPVDFTGSGTAISATKEAAKNMSANFEGSFIFTPSNSAKVARRLNI